VLVLNSEYRTEFKKLKQLIDDFERLAKEEDEDGELLDETDLFKNQLTSLQTSFRLLFKTKIRSFNSLQV